MFTIRVHCLLVKFSNLYVGCKNKALNHLACFNHVTCVWSNYIITLFSANLYLCTMLCPSNSPSKPHDYGSYIRLVEQLVLENSTTGIDQSGMLVAFTALNLKRMKRLNKTLRIDPELKLAVEHLDRPLRMVILTEAWCGDAAQLLPIFNLIQQIDPEKISQEIVLRDENPLLMDQYLTNGKRAIPMLICYDRMSGKELAHWGPRPKVLQEYIRQLSVGGLEKQEWIEKVMLWYTKDKGLSAQHELTTLLESISTETKG